MKHMIRFFLLVLSLSVYSSAMYAQGKNNPCDLISSGKINRLIGCNVREGISVMAGKRCNFNTEDAKVSVSLESYDWKNKGTAMEIMKTTYEEDAKNIAQGKKAVGMYNNIKLFPEAGEHALIMTGEGDATTNGNTVRIQFVLGSTVFTFDTQGIEKGKVDTKALVFITLSKAITGNKNVSLNEKMHTVHSMHFLIIVKSLIRFLHQGIYSNNWCFLSHVAGNAVYLFEGMIAANDFPDIIVVDGAHHHHHFTGNFLFRLII